LVNFLWIRLEKKQLSSLFMYQDRAKSFVFIHFSLSRLEQKLLSSLMDEVKQFGSFCMDQVREKEY
jgi:hypothetical protein